jgi:hypothetical protein
MTLIRKVVGSVEISVLRVISGKVWSEKRITQPGTTLDSPERISVCQPGFCAEPSLFGT